MLNKDDSSSLGAVMVDGLISRGTNGSMSSTALNKIKTEKVRVAPRNTSVVAVNSSPNLNYSRSISGKEILFDKQIDSRLAYWYKNKKETKSYIPKIDLTNIQTTEDIAKIEKDIIPNINRKESKPKKISHSPFGRHAAWNLFKYIGLAVTSFAFFYVIFNYPVVKVQSQYFYNQLVEAKNSKSNNKTSLAKTTEINKADIVQATKHESGNNTNFTTAMSAPAGNRILIPSISVEAPIVFEPSREEEAYQKALASGVVHYAGTGLPGEIGNMVIGGHSSSDWWKPGDYKFIFVNLDKLKTGDRIEIHYNQKKYIYQVEGSKVVEPTDLSVIAPSDRPMLTLFTCTPPGTNWKRLIISARLIEPVIGPSTTNSTQNKENIKQANLPGSTTQTNFIAKSIGSIISLITSPDKSTVSQQRFSLPSTIDI